VGRRAAAGLSRGNRVSHKGTSHSTGGIRPGPALGSADPEERGFRKGIDIGNGDKFTGSQFPARR